MQTALEEAKRVAAFARRQGHAEAEPAPEYSIDGEVGPDNFWTRTISVYLGPKKQAPA